jgi:hypothetical protein
VLSTRTDVAEPEAPLGGMSSTLILDLGNSSSSMLSLPSDPFSCKKGKYEYQTESIVFIVSVYVYENWRDKGIEIGASNFFQ